MTPTFNQSFLLNKIRPNPDLYGPFWICISLIFTIATFIEILCIYGYSLFIYIPVAMLWTLNIVILQWLLVLAAILLSGSVLVFTFWTPFSAERKVFNFYIHKKLIF